MENVNENSQLSTPLAMLVRKISKAKKAKSKKVSLSAPAFNLLDKLFGKGFTVCGLSAEKNESPDTTFSEFKIK